MASVLAARPNTRQRPAWGALAELSRLPMRARGTRTPNDHGGSLAGTPRKAPSTANSVAASGRLLFRVDVRPEMLAHYTHPSRR